MKYKDLKAELDKLTEEQLEQDVRAVGENRDDKIECVWILDEDYIDPEGEGSAPVSEFETDEFFTAEDIAAEPRVAHKGDVFLSLEE